MKQTVLISLGPAGRFTEGRRVRDVWYGSRLLAEVTRRVALIVQSARATIDFPRPERLAHPFFPTHRDPNGGVIGALITNIIRFTFDGDEAALRDLLSKARAAGLEYLRDQADDLWHDRRFRCLVVREDFERHKDAIAAGDALAFFAGWGPNGPAAQQMLAAAKKSRIFDAAPTRPGLGRSDQDAGADNVLFEPDPAHGDVYRRLRRARVRAGLAGAERLHLTGLIKRRAVFTTTDANGPNQRFKLPRQPFPSIPWVAAYPWLRGVADDPASNTALTMLREVFSALWDGRTDAVFTRLGPATQRLSTTLSNGGEPDVAQAFDAMSDAIKSGLPAGEDAAQDALALLSSPITEHHPDGRDQVVFDFDPSVLLDDGVSTLRRAVAELGRRKPIGPVYGDGSRTTIEQALRHSGIDFNRMDDVRALAYAGLLAAEGYVETLQRRNGSPEPYYALIEADGDGIGHIMGMLTDAARARLIEALDRFTDRAWRIPERIGGVVFYCGGDEIVTAVPLDELPHVVGELSSLFRPVVDAVFESDLQPSLSFGVAVAHCKENLARVRARASKALDSAKDDRAAADSRIGHLVIDELPRGGVSRVTRGRLDGGPDDALEAITWFKDAIGWRDPAGVERDLFSMSTAAGLIELCNRFEPHDPQVDANPLALKLARTEFSRRSRRSADGRVDDDFVRGFNTFIEGRLERLVSWNEVRGLANSMFLAERLAQTQAQRRPEVNT